MKKKILVEYNSNNSGGDWWLKDKDWKNLEKAGWRVIYSNEEFIYDKKGSHIRDKNGIPKTKKSNEEKWLGAFAQYAYKHFNSIEEALEEFEKITKQNVLDDGCNCCGPPHEFTWSSSGCLGGGCKCKGPHKDYNFCGGDSCSEYLYGDIGKLTKRELLKLK